MKNNDELSNENDELSPKLEAKLKELLEKLRYKHKGEDEQFKKYEANMNEIAKHIREVLFGMDFILIAVSEFGQVATISTLSLDRTKRLLKDSFSELDNPKAEVQKRKLKMPDKD